MGDRRPSKPWRVIAADGVTTDYTSEPKAYATVRQVIAATGGATVRHWENGTWILWDDCPPADWQAAAEEGKP
jgi:hypothetical protein